MIHTIEIYFLLFMIYSFIGWCIEVVGKFIEYKRFINRGFLIGPYLPIYGWGGLLITILLQKYVNDIITLFVLAMFICSILEYFTSYFMEKIFYARWWDYSTKKFNLNGRICLDTMIPFGLLGLFMIKIVNPIIFKVLNNINNYNLSFIFMFIFTIFLTDNIISLDVLSRVRNHNKKKEKDNTEEMSDKVREFIATTWGEKRLLKAFPNVRKVIRKSINNTIDIMDKALKKQYKIEKETEYNISKLKEEYEYKVDNIKKKADKKINKLNKKKNVRK